MEILSPIRPTARAVIRKERQLLVQVKAQTDGRRYLTLPGGRQEPGESLAECVARECWEEIGARVTVGPLIHVADLFRARPEGMRHQLEMLFACEVPVGYEPRMGPAPDSKQIGTAWADLSREGALMVPRYDLALDDPGAPLYLGKLAHEAP